MPAVSTWLSSHGLSVDQIRPYLSLYATTSNPYDFPQAMVHQSGSAYDVYEYIAFQPSSTVAVNETVIGVWVNAATGTVGKVFTYNYGVGPKLTTLDTYGVAGHQAEDTQLTGTDSMYGAIYNTEVFSDLSNPSGCSTNCWLYADWIGASNYDLSGAGLPSDAYFFQAALVYFGGNEGSKYACNNQVYVANCLEFEYVIDNGTLTPYFPGVGSWTGGQAVNIKWIYNSNVNCQTYATPAQFVTEYINNKATGDSASYTQCMPVITYTQFIEERPVIGSGLYAYAVNPRFVSHSPKGRLINEYDTKIPLSDTKPKWVYNMVNLEDDRLVTSSGLTNYATYSSWTNTWVASYPYP